MLPTPKCYNFLSATNSRRADVLLGTQGLELKCHLACLIDVNYIVKMSKNIVKKQEYVQKIEK